MAAVLGLRCEGLGREVGADQHHAAGPAVHERRLHRKSQVFRGCHVTHSVVHEHAVELAAESNSPHVALKMLALRVEPLADLDHSR